MFALRRPKHHFQSKYLSDRLITSAQNVIPVHARTPSIAVSYGWQRLVEVWDDLQQTVNGDTDWGRACMHRDDILSTCYVSVWQILGLKELIICKQNIGQRCVFTKMCCLRLNISFLADRTNGRAYATVLRLSVVCLWRYVLWLNSAS